MRQRLFSFLFLLSSISAQSFFYSYVDPCEQTVIRTNTVIGGDGQQGFQVTYYNRTKFFTLQEVLDGDLETWTQNVYNDFERLFPCAVKVAEEILSSVIADNVTEQFTKSDISNDPTQVNYAIRSTKGLDRWITQFNSVYTATSFDGNSRHDGNFNFTNDFRKTSLTYGRGFKWKAKKQNVQLSASGLTYKTFEGWDWLISTSAAKSLVKTNPEAAVLTLSYGNVSGVGFGNITGLYALRYPANFSFGKVTFSNYIAYTLLRYYEGNIEGGRYLFLRSPVIFFPTLSFDWKVGTAFTFNVGLSMGYNTVVNDYGERNKTFSLLFGTYF
jgi:hypothetical protein